VLRPAFVFGGGVARTTSSYVAAGTAILGALASAFAMIMLRRISQRETPESISLHFSLVAATACLVLALPTLAVPSARDIGCMIAAGLSAGMAQIAMTRAYALERAARVSGLSYLTVVVSALLGVTFLGEAAPPRALAGMVLVIAGGLVVVMGGDMRR
jgi:drug/metabolite transporter (DMT)-like permease